MGEKERGGEAERDGEERDTWGRGRAGGGGVCGVG